MAQQQGTVVMWGGGGPWEEGWIAPVNGGPWIYVNGSAVICPPEGAGGTDCLRFLNVGDFVSFILQQGPRGYFASNVFVLEWANPAGNLCAFCGQTPPGAQ